MDKGAGELTLVRRMRPKASITWDAPENIEGETYRSISMTWPDAWDEWNATTIIVSCDASREDIQFACLQADEVCSTTLKEKPIVTLGDFLRHMNITLDDCKKALADQEVT
jgi:hypothetical protein